MHERATGDDQGPRHVLLITGAPGIGKTTVIRRTSDGLTKKGLQGFYTEEMREKGERRGFRLVSFDGTAHVIAHVDFPKCHRVGKYGVDVHALDNAARLLQPDPGARVYLVDEIGKMECLSDRFVTAMRACWPATLPWLPPSARAVEASSPRSSAAPNASCGRSPTPIATSCRSEFWLGLPSEHSFSRRRALSAVPGRKLHVPPAWEAAAAEIFERRLRTILVIGGSAVGKSSFCHHLAGALLGRQADVAFVDADVGQSNLGPPATVTLGYPTSPVDFPTVPPAAYYFVGSTGPIGRFLPLVIGTASLAREARGAFVIIDTTGLIHESGRVLKNYKIEAVRPDVIVAVERRNELAPIRMANRHVPIIRIEPSRKAHGKDDYQKIEVRRRSYARHFSGASLLGLPIEPLIFQRTALFTGTRIELKGAIYAERSPDGVLIVGAPACPPAEGKLLPIGFERNLLCGIADGTGRCLGLGIIERIDFAERTIALTTPVERDRVRIIQFGDVYVTPEGGELGQVKWAW